MNRHNMIETVGSQYHQSNIEGGEWSYVKDAGGKAALVEKLGGRASEHFKLDIRFTDSDDTGEYAVLIETKQNFTDEDEPQLRDYVEEEYALHRGYKSHSDLSQYKR